MNQARYFLFPLFVVTLIGVSAGCKKKAPLPPAPPPPQADVQQPPPAPKAPVIQNFVAEPGKIELGRAATLRWKVADATEIDIDQGIGSVATEGSREVSPENATTYRLQAKGPGGAASATASVLVTTPEPPAEAPATPRPSLRERLASEVVDVFYDFDQSSLREDALDALNRNAAVLKSLFTDFPGGVITIEGHCDERGSAEYNIGLGDRRASSAREFLNRLGVPEERLSIISYGKEKPQCSEPDEGCWQKNRRVHFVAAEK